MIRWQPHLVVLPIVLPLAAAALMLFVSEQRRMVKRMVSSLTMLAVLAVAAQLVQQAGQGPPAVYRLGGWPAPFGIVLVADRLAALMVLLASLLALAALVFSFARWDRAGPRFHSLVLVLVMGVNGAFLTGDLFNLFVFFEVFLAASYGLALHGAGAARVQAGLHYIVVNLAAALLFLVGVALIYGVTGTLNLADLALRIPATAGTGRTLLEAGAAVLGIAFLVKAGMWPLCFWLPRAYGMACAPAAAVFVILTKVGIYAILRVWLLFFGGTEAAPHFGQEVLIAGGLLTLAVGAIGVFSSPSLSRLATCSLIVSCGTLLAALGTGDPAVSAASLYYLVASTLGLGTLFLLIEPMERSGGEAGVRSITEESVGSFEAEDREEVGVAIPAAWALLGMSFVVCALLVAGLPPMPGFVAKLALLDALIRPEPVGASAWMLMSLLLLSGLSTLVAASRIGARIFWMPAQPLAARVSAIEMMAVLLLLGAAILLVVQAGPVMQYLGDTAQALHAPHDYLEGVLD